MSAMVEAATCPFGCADLMTGEPTEVRPTNPAAPEDGYFCPDCWSPVSLPATDADS